MANSSSHAVAHQFDDAECVRDARAAIEEHDTIGRDRAVIVDADNVRRGAVRRVEHAQNAGGAQGIDPAAA